MMTSRVPLLQRAIALGLAVAAAPCAFAAGRGEFVDKMATVLAVFIIIAVPIIGIVLFWLVHVLPEKIAEKRHHPQREGITTLCLLSLVFGGILWPLAWLWAYTKPVAYRVAYGTDKHEDYCDEMALKQREGKLLREEAFYLREEIEAMEARGALPPRLRALKEELAQLRLADAATRASRAHVEDKAA